MLHFIYPTDESTNFLLEIPNTLSEKYGSELIKIITVLPSDQSYSASVSAINDLPDNSTVIFMGHGQDDRLWGAEDQTFSKKAFISKSQSKVFSNKHLLCLSCYSNEFLKGTFAFSKIISSIGFGSLPTEMGEVKNNKRLKELGITDPVIDRYKIVLIDIIVRSLSEMIEKNLSFAELSSFLKLILNKLISEVVLMDKSNAENRILSDLLFQMKTEMVYI